MSPRISVIAALAVSVIAVGVLSAHETDVPEMVLGSTTAGGGALTITHDFADPVVVAESFATGGFVLYTSADPSFEVPATDEPEEGLFRLADGTAVTVEATSVDDGVAMKLRGETLDRPGDVVVLGTMPDLHAHPEWQLTLPEGARDCRRFAFRVTTTSATYTASATYEALLTNDASTCARATPACGDADGNGSVTVTDGVATLRAAAGLDGPCAATTTCDVDASGGVTVSDGVNVLRAAAGLATSLQCPDS